jgi:hypothetical protein
MLTISSINPKNKHLFKIVITLKQSKKKPFTKSISQLIQY